MTATATTQTIFMLKIYTSDRRPRGLVSTSYSRLIGSSLDEYLRKEFNLQPLTKEQRHTLAMYDELLIVTSGGKEVLIDIKKKDIIG